ncbi:UNVERIFIED_CONTAM: PAS domain-containing protein, partial [Salmonella enterica subsp. enterica serovar Weltevreden]
GRPARALRIAREEGRFEDTAWRLRKDGRQFWAHVVIDLIRDERGAPAGFAKITRDITEQWQAQRLLRDAQRALRNTQQFETVGRLSRGLSHE